MKGEVEFSRKEIIVWFRVCFRMNRRSQTQIKRHVSLEVLNIQLSSKETLTTLLKQSVPGTFPSETSAGSETFPNMMEINTVKQTNAQFKQ